MGTKKIFTLLALHLLFCSSWASNSSSPLRSCVVATAATQVGVVEATGKNDGVQVEAYLASVGQKKGAPYCAAFCAWVFKQCKQMITGNAFSPSWFPASKVVMQGQKGWDLVQPGDVFGLYFASHKRIAHVGFIESQTRSHIITIEANTSPAPAQGEADRNGDGVWRKRRMKRGIFKVSNWINK